MQIFKDKQPFSCDTSGQFKVSNSLKCLYLECGRKSEYLERTSRHGRMSKLHRGPGDSVTEASCCEAIVINTAPQCNIKTLSMCLNKSIVQKIHDRVQQEQGVDRFTTSTPDYGCFIYNLAATGTEVSNAARSRPTTAIKVELWEIPPHLGKEIFNLTNNI